MDKLIHTFCSVFINSESCESHCELVNVVYQQTKNLSNNNKERVLLNFLFKCPQNREDQQVELNQIHENNLQRQKRANNLTRFN
jgi:hypothetical protein